MYTYEMDGVTIESPEKHMAGGESLLNSALAMAAVISFQKSRPVILRLQGQPYRLVSVEFINSTTRKAPANAI